MYIVFFSTNNVFEAEEKLTNLNINCQVVPTPVTDKAYCGVCLEVSENKNIEYVLKGMEYKVVN